MLFFPEICEDIIYALVRDWLGENTVFGTSRIVWILRGQQGTLLY